MLYKNFGVRIGMLIGSGCSWLFTQATDPTSELGNIRAVEIPPTVEHHEPLRNTLTVEDVIIGGKCYEVIQNYSPYRAYPEFSFEIECIEGYKRIVREQQVRIGKEGKSK